jgi:hypothetical protein
MFLVTNKGRRTIKISEETIERGKSVEFTNDEWDDLRKLPEVIELYTYGKITAEKVKSK